MTAEVDWLQHQPYRCAIYPARDCPGWHHAQPCFTLCQRIGVALTEAGERATSEAACDG